ncbi:MAG: aldo/keto reductase [Bacteroidota bacterium]
MEKRPFGATGFDTTPIAFGAMRIKKNASGISEAMLYALEKGINFIDTARNYGESESIVRRTLKEWNGERPFIASKVQPLDITNWRFPVPLEVQFTPKSITESVETSLKMLDVDCIDLIQMHQWYYLWGLRPEWLDTLKRLQKEGKVRFIGVSALDHEHDAVLKIIDDKVVDAVQIAMNAFESRPFTSVTPLSKMRNVAVIGRCIFDHSASLARGGNRDVLANDIKLSKGSPEIVTEYINRIDQLVSECCTDLMPLNELSVRFALSDPGVSNIALSMGSRSSVDSAIAFAKKGPLEADLVEKIKTEHIWVKNFNYFSKATQDGKIKN